MTWFFSYSLLAGMLIVVRERQELRVQNVWVTTFALTFASLSLFFTTTAGPGEVFGSAHLSLDVFGQDGAPAMASVALLTPQAGEGSWLVPIRILIPYGNILIALSLLLGVFRLFGVSHAATDDADGVDRFGVVQVLFSLGVLGWFGYRRLIYNPAEEFERDLIGFDVGTIHNIELPTFELFTALDAGWGLVFALILLATISVFMSKVDQVLEALPRWFANPLVGQLIALSTVLVGIAFMLQAGQTETGYASGYALLVTCVLAGWAVFEDGEQHRLWCGLGLCVAGTFAGAIL